MKIGFEARAIPSYCLASDPRARLCQMSRLLLPTGFIISVQFFSETRERAVDHGHAGIGCKWVILAPKTVAHIHRPLINHSFSLLPGDVQNFPGGRGRSARKESERTLTRTIVTESSCSRSVLALFVLFSFRKHHTYDCMCRLFLWL